MSTPIFTLPLRSKRDVVTARQRARQLAGLLGFDWNERIVIATTVFEIACRVYQHGGRADLLFQVEGNLLQIGAAEAWLEKRLPGGAQTLARADVIWGIRALARHTPLDLFEEIHQHNQELLRAAQELRRHQSETTVLLTEPAPVAA